MMTQEEFEVWGRKLNLSSEAKKEIEKIRNSPPARRVGGGRHNVSGRFSSKKMGVTIQFESHKVELPAIYTMEFNEKVLEYYDQPPSIKLSYSKSSGKKKKVTYMYTPDFFVIEEDKAYWVEWKTEESLIKLSQEKADRYFRENNQWVFTLGKDYANNFQLDFLLCSSKDINWKLQRNLTFLEDYIFKKYVVKEERIQLIKRRIAESPGMTLSELIQNPHGHYSSDDIYYLISQNIIYMDLYNSLIMEPEDVRLFLNKEQSNSIFNVEKSQTCNKKISKIQLEIGENILWGEKTWSILNYSSVDESVFLYEKEGQAHVRLPLNIFESYIKSGYIKGLEVSSYNTGEVREIISQATESDLTIANERYENVMEYLNENYVKSSNVTDRTIRNWIKKFKEAEELYGNGYLGLLPSIKKRGNRNPKIPIKTKELMNQIIEESYKTNKLKTAKAVYRELIVKSEELNVFVPSYQTFCEAIKKYSYYELELSRRGKRAAYTYEKFHWELEFTTPKHGDRIFEIAHIDHTELDIELVINQKESKRPWCTFMIDAFSRRILAMYLTFDPPSYTSAMMVIRDCVKKYNRLPNYVIVDGGKEFKSIYFESLLALYGVHKKERPPAKARFGNVIERLFGITNQFFIHNLTGNTQIMKNVRQVTKTVNPKQHAIWTMDSLYERLNKWINDIHDNLENPSLNQTPKEAFEKSIQIAGNRKQMYIPYDETFILMTLPAVNGRTRRVHPAKGIKLNYAYYWCEKFRDPKVENSNVEVKYDPFNIGIAYAYVNNRWEKCLSEQYTIFQGKTEKQLKIITAELKEKKKIHSKNNSITARMIAKFILESEDIEHKLSSERYKIREGELQLKVDSNTIDNNPEEEGSDLESDDLEIYGEML